MCVTVYSLFTVCGHCPTSDEQKCEIYSSYSSLKKKLLACCDAETSIVKFVFGWCPGCKEVLFEDVTADTENEETHELESRNIHAIRRYWEYKFIIGCATAVDPTKRLRFVANLDQDMVKGLSTWEGISAVNRLMEMMKLGREFSFSQRAMDFSQLTVDEATLQRALLSLKPSEIWLGPKKHSYAIASRDKFATVLHTARIATIMWANGDDKIYEKEPEVSLHWESPYAPEIWNVARYGEAGAGTAEALSITGITWRLELKLRVESLMEALTHILK